MFPKKTVELRLSENSEFWSLRYTYSINVLTLLDCSDSQLSSLRLGGGGAGGGGVGVGPGGHPLLLPPPPPPPPPASQQQEYLVPGEVFYFSYLCGGHAFASILSTLNEISIYAWVSSSTKFFKIQIPPTQKKPTSPFSAAQGQKRNASDAFFRSFQTRI